MQSLLIQVREVLARGDTTTALILAGIAVAVILVIVGAVLIVARMYTPRGRLELLLESRVRERDAGPWVTRVIVMAVLVLVFAATTYYSETPESCVNCHADPVYTEALAESAHASVACADCHRAAGPLGRVDDALRYTGWLVDFYILDERAEVGSGAAVDPRRCLRCHGAISEGVVESNGVRVRHADFIDGADCLRCHGDIGHSQPRGVQTQPVMNACMGCHDGEVASVECAQCHTQDLGVRAVAERGGGMDTVGFRTVDCYACHDRRPCFECHGVEVPHPPGFSFPAPQGGLPGRIGTGLEAGTHAREGFANREVCWRCHFAPGRQFEPSDEGCSCHGLFGFIHGGPVWVQEHGLQATGQKPGALSACGSCHGPPSQFCGFCHPPSYAERYAPVEGADTYTPSPGWPRPADPLTDF
jgi:hypothetical protein